MTKILPSLTMVVYASIAAFALGSGAGYWATSGWYAPRLELEKAKVASLNVAITRQNEAVEELGTQTTKLREDLKAAQAAAKKRSAVRKTSAARIMAATVPAGKDQCQAASDLIRLELAK